MLLVLDNGEQVLDACAELRWTPLSSVRCEVRSLSWSVMAAWLGSGGRRDDNDDTSL